MSYVSPVCVSSVSVLFCLPAPLGNYMLVNGSQTSGQPPSTLPSDHLQSLGYSGRLSGMVPVSSLALSQDTLVRSSQVTLREPVEKQQRAMRWATMGMVLTAIVLLPVGVVLRDSQDKQVSEDFKPVWIGLVRPR